MPTIETAPRRGAAPFTLAALLALSALTALVSAALYVGFFLAMGDPLRLVGSAHGDYETTGLYYRPLLVLAAACLAFPRPRYSVFTGLVLIGVQLVSLVVALGLHDPNQLWWAILVVPMAFVEVAPWVIVGTAAGAGVRVAARSIGSRFGSG